MRLPSTKRWLKLQERLMRPVTIAKEAWRAKRTSDWIVGKLPRMKDLGSTIFTSFFWTSTLSLVENSFQFSNTVGTITKRGGVSILLGINLRASFLATNHLTDMKRTYGVEATYYTVDYDHNSIRSHEPFKQIQEQQFLEAETLDGLYEEMVKFHALTKGWADKHYSELPRFVEFGRIFIALEEFN